MLDIDAPPFWRMQLGRPGNVDRWQIIRFEVPCTIVLDVGVALAGTRGVERVELSVDDGETWVETTLRPPLSRQAWTIWLATWTPPKSGPFRLKVRATDGLGQPQDPRPRPPIPDGATGYHEVAIAIE